MINYPSPRGSAKNAIPKKSYLLRPISRYYIDKSAIRLTPLKPSIDTNLISTKEASALSSYNADYLSRLCREGRIEGKKIGRSWLISRISLTRFIESQKGEKKVRAKMLSQQRGSEYSSLRPTPLRYATATVPSVSLPSLTPNLSRLDRLAAATAPPRRFVSIPVSQSTRDYVVALAITFAAIGGSIYGVESDLGRYIGPGSIAVASQARHEVLAMAESLDTYSAARLQMQRTLATQSATMRSTGLAVRAVTASELKERAAPLTIAGFDTVLTGFSSHGLSANAASAVSYAAPAAHTKEPTLLPLSPSTQATITTGGIAALRAYAAIGTSLLAFVDTTSALYQQAVLDTAYIGTHLVSAVVHIAIQVPEASMETQIALGEHIQGASARIMNGYGAAIDGEVAFAPLLAQNSVLALYTLGDTVASVTAVAIVNTPHAYDSAVFAYANTIPIVAERATRVEVALGTSLNSATKGMLDGQLALMDRGGSTILNASLAFLSTSGSTGSSLASSIKQGTGAVAQTASAYASLPHATHTRKVRHVYR